VRSLRITRRLWCRWRNEHDGEPRPCPVIRSQPGFFVKVVIRRGDHFLLVQERRFNQPWHVPAGRADPGETLVAAALRETMEEAAVPVILDGILRVEHSPLSDKPTWA